MRRRSTCCAPARQSSRGEGCIRLIDLEMGAQGQLTNLAPDFNVRGFDVCPDGHEILECVQEHAGVVLNAVLRHD